jgi:hypothetical protein
MLCWYANGDQRWLLVNCVTKEIVGEVAKQNDMEYSAYYDLHKDITKSFIDLIYSILP